MSEFKGDELRVRTRRSDKPGRRNYDPSLAHRLKQVRFGLEPGGKYRGAQAWELSCRDGKDRRDS